MAQKYFIDSEINVFLFDFIATIFPRVCVCCQNVLIEKESFLCLPCSQNMPHTHFALYKDNPVEKLFWNKTPIDEATAAFFFTKKSMIQKMVHDFKYNNKPTLAYYLGRMLGELILQSNRFKNIDLIIPVPLHPIKKRQRGYNQASKIAQGVSFIIGIPMENKILNRTQYAHTQTRSTLYDRWTNVKQLFDIKYPEILTGRHILLIDDVITSGATLEACAKVTLAVNQTKVSVATLAISV